MGAYLTRPVATFLAFPVARASMPRVRGRHQQEEDSTMQKDDELDLSLNPHRTEERAAAAMETAARLASRGIRVTGQEDSEDLVDLLTAVEQFEEMVEARGGDLMVDDLKSSQPDDPHFVVPERQQGEGLRSYLGRVEAATARLRSHPSLPDRASSMEG
jgi:hypothetical protein